MAENKRRIKWLSIQFIISKYCKRTDKSMRIIRKEFEYDLLRRGKANLIKRFWRRQVRKIVPHARQNKVAFFNKAYSALLEH